jgi:hypothetical protein
MNRKGAFIDRKGAFMSRKGAFMNRKGAFTSFRPVSASGGGSFIRGTGTIAV